MTDDILARLRRDQAAWSDRSGIIWDDNEAAYYGEAADEIERLRRDNVILRMATGEEGRANRMKHLYETTLDEVQHLLAQIAELLPWAKAGAGNLVPFGTGLTAEDGQRLLDRIDAGEFGELS